MFRHSIGNPTDRNIINTKLAAVLWVFFLLLISRYYDHFGLLYLAERAWRMLNAQYDVKIGMTQTRNDIIAMFGYFRDSPACFVALSSGLLLALIINHDNELRNDANDIFARKGMQNDAFYVMTHL